MRKGESVDGHMSAEGIELNGSDWNSGDDVPYFFVEGLEEFISDKVSDSDKDADETMVTFEPSEEDEGFFGIPEFLSGDEEEDLELASREEVMEFADEIYDSFEEAFDIEIPEEVRDDWKERTVYDEGLGFKLRKTVNRTEFSFPMVWALGGATAGFIGNTYRAWEKHDNILENGGGFEKADMAREQAMALNDEIALGALALGAAYGLKQAYPSMSSDFTGKFHRSRPPIFRSLDLGGRDEVIAITPDKKSPEGAFYTGVAENLHMLQEDINSLTTYDPLLEEGMDIFAKYLVGKEMEDSDVLDIDHEEKALGIRDDALLKAYGILKNNGGYMVDDDTYIDVGLDPEESKRMAECVEAHMARSDRSDDQLFGYAVGGAYLIMEYEKGNIEPGEVLRDGEDAMPWQFRQIYDTAMMENI